MRASGPSIPESFLLLEASNTPESPATLSSDTAADTEHVFVPEELARERMPIGGGVSLIGDSGGSCVNPILRSNKQY
jgi:flavin-dependent dehydrogenase